MDKSLLAVMALALALPSTILAVSWIAMELVQEGLISYGVAVVIIIAVIANIFYMMFKHLKKQRKLDQDDQ